MADKNNFVESVELTRPNRSAFDLSHFNHLTAKLGKLIPVMCEPMVPGDTFKGSAEAYVRQAPMLAPIKGEYEVEVTHYFVPNRLLWKNWQKFITGGQDGQQSPSFPRYNVFGSNCRLFGTGTLADYLGYNLPIDTVNISPDGRPMYCDTPQKWAQNIPTGQTNVGQSISALPFKAYQLICDTYWSDENIDTHLCGELATETFQDFFVEGGIVQPLSSSSITDRASYAAAMCQLRTACYRKDYFTAALPWTQRGGAVTLPLSGDASIYNGSSQQSFANIGLNGVVPSDGEYNAYIDKSSSGVNIRLQGGETPAPEFDNQVTFRTDMSNWKADISNINSTTINDLRAAFALQRWLEKNAVGGSRYIEQILAHFGVRDRDARLQRPEYITGNSSTFQISETLQTSASSTDGSTTPQGNPTGNGQSYNKDNGFSYTADEHGYFITLMVIRPFAIYFQGLKKDFFKFDKLDFLWPDFAHLGEQEVNTMELVNRIGDPDTEGATFGYMPRYSEYRFINNSMHGDFRGNLFYWTNGRTLDHNLLSRLTPTFLHVDPADDEQVYNVTDADVDKFWCDVHIGLKAIRPLPLYATPKLQG